MHAAKYPALYSTGIYYIVPCNNIYVLWFSRCIQDKLFFYMSVLICIRFYCWSATGRFFCHLFRLNSRTPFVFLAPRILLPFQRNSTLLHHLNVYALGGKMHLKISPSAECARALPKTRFPTFLCYFRKPIPLDLFSHAWPESVCAGCAPVGPQNACKSSAHVLVQWANHCASIKAHNNFIIL